MQVCRALYSYTCSRQRRQLKAKFITSITCLFCCIIWRYSVLNRIFKGANRFIAFGFKIDIDSLSTGQRNLYSKLNVSLNIYSGWTKQLPIFLRQILPWTKILSHSETRRNLGQGLPRSGLWDRYWGQNKRPEAILTPVNDPTNDWEIRLAPDFFSFLTWRIWIRFGGIGESRKISSLASLVKCARITRNSCDILSLLFITTAVVERREWERDCLYGPRPCPQVLCTWRNVKGESLHWVVAFTANG